MTVTPGPGYQVDPNNSNGVIPIGTTSPSAPTAPTPTADPNIPGSPTYNPTGGAPINRTVDTSTQPNNDPTTAEGFLNTFKAPQTQDQIAEQMRTGAQGQIDAINGSYDQTIAEAKTAGQGRVDSNNATSILSGLMGSTEAVRTDNAVKDANSKEQNAILSKKALDLATVYTKINSDARAEAQKQLEDATANAKDVVARRAQVQSDAVNNLKLMASSGLVDYNKFKTDPNNAAVYAHALQAVGGSETALQGLFATNRPTDQLIGSPTRVGNSYIQAYKNPLTGKVSYDTVPLPAGLGANYTSFQKVGKNNDTLIAIPDNWNGDMSQIKTIYQAPGSSAPGMVQLTDSSGKPVSVPVDVAPYYNTSHSGVPYADLSTVQGTADEKKGIIDAAQAAGIKVITNKNTALDVTNIDDANAKLDSIATIMAGIDQSNVLARDLGGMGLTGLASLAQTDPQKAAAGSLQSVGLDILKAMSGVQGFRGNSSVVQQINDHLPTIYDTDATVKAKVSFIRALLNDRENAILGSSGNNASDASIANGGGPGITVTDPSGGVHSFPDQKSADAFKKAAGIQ